MIFYKNRSTYSQRLFEFLMTDDDIVLLPELKVSHSMRQQRWKQCFDSVVDRVLLFMEDNVALRGLRQWRGDFGHVSETMQLKCREITIKKTVKSKSEWKGLAYLSMSYWASLYMEELRIMFVRVWI